MTDEPEDDAVRRLLADVRHTDPVPADVAARLDAVIRGLAQEDEDLAPVVALPRHRRRAAAALLAAAAAIVVGGVSLASLEHRGGTPASTAGAAAETSGDRSADSSGQSFSSSDSPSAAAGSAGSGTGSDTGGAATPQAERAQPVRVRAHHFATDAARAREGAQTKGGTPDRRLTSEFATCRAGSLGAGVRLPASYHGSKAVLVYRAPAGGSQVVDLYLCGDRSPVRTTTLPQVP